MAIDLVAAPSPAHGSSPARDARVSFKGVTFTLPAGVAGSTHGAIIPASTGGLGGPRPKSLRFTFSGYAWSNHGNEAEMQIFPTAGLATGHLSELAMLRSILKNRPSLAKGLLPTITVVNAGEAFHAKESYEHFGNGTGISYVGYWTQAVFPLSNQDPLYYSFQGLTNDGRYAVGVFLPVRIPFLPSTVPTMNASQEKAFEKGFTAYIQRIANRVRALPASRFLPGLGSMLQMVRSLTVHPVGIG